MDATESNIDVEQGYETVQRVDNIQVEETCVLVNGDELCFVPCREDKHRPYKVLSLLCLSFSLSLLFSLSLSVSPSFNFS